MGVEKIPEAPPGTMSPLAWRWGYVCFLKGVLVPPTATTYSLETLDSWRCGWQKAWWATSDAAARVLDDHALDALLLAYDVLARNLRKQGFVP